MSTQSQNNNGYMLIFRSTDWYKGLSPEQMQQIADNWMAWFNRLKDEGKAIAGNPLERDVELVVRDVRNGGVSIKRAREIYGVVIHEATLVADQEATDKVRKESRMPLYVNRAGE